MRDQNKMKRILLLVSFALAAFMGCGMKKEYIRVTDQLDSIEVREKRIERRTAELDSISKVQTNLIYELKAELKSISASLGERLNIMEQREDDNKYRTLPIGPSTPDKPDTVGNHTNPAKEPGPKELYDAAYLDITRGNYDLAQSAFAEFLKRYPAHELSDNAQYWMGEGYYAQKKYPQALAEFQKVTENYAGKDKEAAAMYKAGLCFKEMGEPQKAKEKWQALVKKYPKSPEAGLAREKLK
jgi:tol-pal system protein YbgF